MILAIRFWLSKQAGFPVRKPQQRSNVSNYEQAFSLSCTRQQYIYLFVKEPLTDEKRLEVLEVVRKKRSYYGKSMSSSSPGSSPIRWVLLHFPVLREIGGETHAFFM